MARFGRSFPIPRRRVPKYAALPRVVELTATFTQTETLTVSITKGVALTATFTETQTLTVSTVVTRAPQLPYITITPSFSSREIRNRITVTRTGGAAQVAADAASITAYGVREFSRASLASTDTDSTAAAAWLLAKYKSPLLRFDGLTVKPRKEPATLFPHVLGREIGDRITIMRKPQAVGTGVVKFVLIEGATQTITRDDWVTSFNLSPVDTVAPY